MSAGAATRASSDPAVRAARERALPQAGRRAARAQRIERAGILTYRYSDTSVH